MNLQTFSRYLLVAALFIINSQAQAAIPQSERDALLALYTTTGGDNWHNKTGWNGAAETECSWYGVTCNIAGDTVTGLDLKANNLLGYIPPELISLTNLATSDFRYNGLTGSSCEVEDVLAAVAPNFMDTQTVSPNLLGFTSLGVTSVGMKWDSVNYPQAGGYRIYLSDTRDGVYTQSREISDKAVTNTTLTGLVACQQYFVTATSYTSPHSNNPNEVEGLLHNYFSEGAFIPNWSAGCINVNTNGDAVIDVNSDGHRYRDLLNGNETIYKLYGGYGDCIDCGDPDAIYINDFNVGGNITINNRKDRGGIHFVGTGFTHSFGPEVLSLNAAGPISSASQFRVISQVPKDTFLYTIPEQGEVITRIRANAFEGETISYSIMSGNARGDLVLETIGGEAVIRANRRLDDDPFVDSLVVKITNGADYTKILSIFIIVQPGLFPVIKYFPDTISVREDATPGTEIASATFSPTLGFSIISGNVNNAFAIDSTGMITVNTYLAHDTTSVYELVIRIGNDPCRRFDIPVRIEVEKVTGGGGGGCTLRPRAPFDPIWMFMLLLAGVYYQRRHRQLD